jgi:hypothetical protein
LLPRQLVLLGALGAILVGACDSDLALILTGKRCSPVAPQCLDGYACIEGFCRIRGQDQGGLDSGAGGDEALAGTGGQSGTDTSGVGGTPPFGGAGSQGGSSAIDIPDASVFLDGGPDGCVPVDLYRDRDGDSVGDVSVHAFGCIRPGWVEVSGDCRDDIAAVHPGQTEFFATGYPDANAPEEVSFDYDCSNVESSDTTNDPGVAAPRCTGLSVAGLACGGEGYQKTARAGVGINSLCGSDVVVSCITSGASCVARELAVQRRFHCN